MNTKLILVSVAALLVGGLIGFVSGQSTHSTSEKDIAEMASIMQEDGSAMQQMGKKIAEDGQMMRMESGNDQKIINIAQEMENNGIRLEKKGRDIMSHGKDLETGRMLSH